MIYSIVLNKKSITYAYRGFRYRHRKLYFTWYTACFVAEYLVSH